MKNKIISLLLVFIALTGCNKTPSVKTYEEPSYDEKYVANFMLNYKRETIDAISGNKMLVDNILYEQKEIELGKVFSAPDINPIRINFEFGGWYKEAECINPYNFSTLATGNISLFAKWGISSSGEFVEPEFVYENEIISDHDFVVKDVLNMPVENNKVYLSTGAINRLIKHKDNVNFAIHFAHKETILLSKATYDNSTKTISLTLSSKEVINIQVIDNTLNLSLASENSTYESKAATYEKSGSDYEDYHIMLAGSSSMEFWSNSKEDLNPIVSYNTGIGGTTVNQWRDKLLERLVFPYSPKAVVFYVGVNNIINSGNTGEETGLMLKQLLDKTHEHLPYSQVFYVLINSLPGYARCQNDFDKANQMVLDYAQDKAWMSCIDAGACLLKESGKPNSAYFRTDGLHMSLYGYVLWGNEIKKALIEWLSK